IDEAVQRYLGMIDREALRDLDRQAQAMIERQFTALAHVCLTSSDLMVSLEAAMLQLARRFMQQRLGEADVAEMFLSRAFDAEVSGPPGPAGAARVRTDEFATIPDPHPNRHPPVVSARYDIRDRLPFPDRRTHARDR